MNARSSVILLTLFTLSCSGSSAPPPPSSSPPPRNGSPDGEQGRAALPPGHPPIEGTRPGPDEAAEPREAVVGTIELAEPLRSGILPTDVLYVMARRDGATVAVRRVEAPSFPFSFEISGVDAMVASTQLAGPVDIVARVSRTGDAIASAGDLEGQVSGVTVPAQGVTLLIDRVRE